MPIYEPRKEPPEERQLRTLLRACTQSVDLVPELLQYDPRDVTLLFERAGPDDAYRCVLLFTDDPVRSWEAHNMPVGQINSAVQELRGRWDEAIRGTGMEVDVDLTDYDQDELGRVLSRLVKDGTALFDTIFHPGHDPDCMTDLRRELIGRLRSRECGICVWSNDLYAPWALLCLPRATGAVTDADGTRESGPPPTAAEIWGPCFLGYRHLIEHRARSQHALCPSPQIPLDGQHRPATLSLIVEDAPKSHQQVVRLLRDRTDLLDCQWRAADFLDQLHADLFTRQIIYLYCHGQDYGQDPARLTPSGLATDAIAALDITRAINGSTSDHPARPHCRVTHLKSSPLLYLSVCRAADFAPPGGSSVARTLTELGTACAVAPEVIMPKEFAVEHAYRFFESFLDQRVSAGRHLREVTQALAKDAANPLGLVYAVKGRMDTRLGQPVTAVRRRFGKAS